MLISSNLFWELSRRCASRSVNNAAEAPARLSAVPNFAMPEIVYVFGGLFVRIWTRSPTSRSASSAVRLSMTTSSAFAGGFPPLTSRKGFSSSLSPQSNPSVGGP
jgi:hypothetical protein